MAILKELMKNCALLKTKLFWVFFRVLKSYRKTCWFHSRQKTIEHFANYSIFYRSLKGFRISIPVLLFRFRVFNKALVFRIVLIKENITSHFVWNSFWKIYYINHEAAIIVCIKFHLCSFVLLEKLCFSSN